MSCRDFSTFPALLACMTAFVCAGCGAVSTGAMNRSVGDSEGLEPPGPASRWSRAVPDVPDPEPGRPLVAIVIDDCGVSADQLEPFLGMPVPLSFSILPYLPGVQDTVALLAREGLETLVHVPMEPDDPRWLENDWFLTTDMNERQIRASLLRSIEAVPTASGMNNHMGSKFCANHAAMTTVMQVARDIGIYYLDSRTGIGSMAGTAAAEQGARLLERSVFLDNDDDVSLITRQLEQLIESARTQGCAVGIGHARPATARAIREFVNGRDHGVTFVPAGRLFDYCPAAADAPSLPDRTPQE
ncbi:MAG TPA: divergent polysaccharide deacetylase family protein [Myxococcota bacterium]|mgnify:FL=1|nr:divergent polysaccharide deacetylase family protein [Myxococcota bacterium]HQP96277.1 divergent polysaccharide deacetylase family protein [Myxococcota bacterium]